MPVAHVHGFVSPKVSPELVAERMVLAAFRHEDAAMAAERARAHANALADAGLMLGASLETEATYDAVARIKLPWSDTSCVIELVEPTGATRRIELQRGDPGSTGSPASRPELLRDGGERRTAPIEPLTHVASMVAHGIPLGVITVTRRAGGQPFGAADIAFVDALAMRCAQALEAARLYATATAASAAADAARADAEAAHQSRAHDEALFRSLTERSLEFVAILDPDGRFRYVSPSAERTVGVEAPLLVGTRPADLVHADDRDGMLETFAALLREGPGAVAEISVRLRHADGSWRAFEGDGQNLMHDPFVRGITMNVRDVTARVELETQLRQALKMEAVGHLAGGVAHDFNNLLTVIGAHRSFLMDECEPASESHADAVAIKDASDRAAALTGQLLAFSRKQIVKPVVVNLNAQVRATGTLLTRLLGEDIEIVLSLADDCCPVLADPTQIDQVLMNLALNARDAMSDGGRLTITTKAERITSDVVGAARSIPAGEYALLTVADTGVGMTAAVQGRLFEPFFTTKGVGRGTGLGLSTVFGIVKQTGGFVAVHSEVGKGSVFRVYLPAVSGNVPRAGAASGAHPGVKGVVTVLLVEDEQAVRAVASRVLRGAGYVVLEAESGDRAQRVAAAHDGPIDLVISDAVMPGLTGAATVSRLQEARPGLRALFMSGFTDDEVMRRGINASQVRFIQKPFTPAAFRHAVHEALTS